MYESVSLIGWKPSDLLEQPITLKQLLRITDTHLLFTWDHTAQINFHLGVIAAIEMSAHSGKKVSPRPLDNYHPYRKKQLGGHRINKKNFSVLLQLGDVAKRGY